MKKSSILNSQFSISSGFTLVELLLTLSLSVTIAIISIGGFVQFNSLQNFNNAVSEVTTVLQKAKSHAISQVKPTSVAACASNQLDGYEVRLCGLPGSSCAGAGQYNMYVICGGSNLLETDVLPSGVTFASGSTTAFTFNLLNGSATSGSIVLNGFGRTKTIQVSSIGIISVQ